MWFGMLGIPCRASIIDSSLFVGWGSSWAFWVFWWNLAISSAIFWEFEVYWGGEGSRRQSSIMVSCPFFSLPCAHQYLFIISPWRCQLAFVMFWFFLNRVDWASWILEEIWLVFSRAISRSVPSSELALLMILSFFSFKVLNFRVDFAYSYLSEVLGILSYVVS